MRRVVALLTLASAGSAQSIMLGCPMASGETLGAAIGHAASHGGQASHDAPPADRDAWAVAQGSTSRSVPGCPMPIGCGTAGITAPHSTGTPGGAPTLELHSISVAAACSTVFPAHDPPPPRSTV